MKKILSTIMCIALTGCGATPTEIQFSALDSLPGKYGVYVYNQCGVKQHQGPRLFVNGEQRAVLVSNTFYSTYSEEPTVDVSVKPDSMNYSGMETLSIKAEIPPGQKDIYVKFTGIANQNEPTLYIDYTLRQVSKAQGEKEISHCFRAKSGYYSDSASTI